MGTLLREYVPQSVVSASLTRQTQIYRRIRASVRLIAVQNLGNSRINAGSVCISMNKQRSRPVIRVRKVMTSPLPFPHSHSIVLRDRNALNFKCKFFLWTTKNRLSDPSEISALEFKGRIFADSESAGFIDYRQRLVDFLQTSRAHGRNTGKRPSAPIIGRALEHLGNDTRERSARRPRVLCPDRRRRSVPLVLATPIGAAAQQQIDNDRLALASRRVQRCGRPMAARRRGIDVNAPVEQEADDLRLSAHSGEDECLLGGGTLIGCEWQKSGEGRASSDIEPV
jgi:hypothetical protein